MKRFAAFLLSHALVFGKAHRQAIVTSVNRGLFSAGGFLLSHLGFRAGVIETWQWLCEPAAIALFWGVGWICGRLIDRWGVETSKAAVRVAVAAVMTGARVDEVPKAAIAAVPDSLHDEAVAKVAVMNKNGGVPAPNC